MLDSKIVGPRLLAKRGAPRLEAGSSITFTSGIAASVGGVGQPSDIADAITAVMANGFITGTVLHVDGGQRLI